MTVNQVQVAYAIMSIKTGMSALLAVVSGALAALSPVNTPTRLVGRCASVLGWADWLCLQGGLPPDILPRALSPKDTRAGKSGSAGVITQRYSSRLVRIADRGGCVCWGISMSPFPVLALPQTEEKAENMTFSGRPIPVVAVWVLATYRMETGWDVLPGPIWAPSTYLELISPSTQLVTLIFHFPFCYYCNHGLYKKERHQPKPASSKLSKRVLSNCECRGSRLHS